MEVRSVIQQTAIELYLAKTSYTCKMNDRMAALLTRFEHQTLPIMVRHGILQVGFWTTIQPVCIRAIL